jgi:hypothetical protein
MNADEVFQLSGNFLERFASHMRNFVEFNIVIGVHRRSSAVNFFL